MRPPDLTDIQLAARSHQSAIDELWDFDDPTVSLDRFQAAAQAADSALTRDVLLTQVARALGLSGRFDEATAMLDALSADGSAAVELRVRGQLERGRVLNSSGSPAEARPLFEAAFGAAFATSLEHLAVDALHMVAIVAPVEEQEPLIRRALELAAGASDPRARQWRASLLNNLGWTVFERGDYPAALALFEEALEERIGLGKVAQIQIARWCIGRTLRALGRLDEALAVQQFLAREHAAAGTHDPDVDEEIAECLRELG